MGELPYSHDGITILNIEFSNLQLFLALEMMYNVFSKESIVKEMDISGGSLCSVCHFPPTIDVYLTLENGLSKNFKKINWKKYTPEQELTQCSTEFIHLLWERQFKEDLTSVDPTDCRWYLGKSGHPLCGMRFNDVFTGKKSFDTCPCPIEYRTKICEKLKKIVDAVHSVENVTLVEYILQK
ncbi:MAG: hypothetical protein HZB92_05005 [Euryarchaeota archaeon]|nr:hypothetical protein [Euryarchaeota archaeon]